MGRHASPDPISTALGIAWAATTAVGLAVVALVARQPADLNAQQLRAPVPASAPDTPPPDTT